MRCKCEKIERIFVEHIVEMAAKLYDSQDSFAYALYGSSEKSASQKWYRIRKGQPISLSEACRACQLINTNLPDVITMACRISDRC